MLVPLKINLFPKIRLIIIDQTNLKRKKTILMPLIMEGESSEESYGASDEAQLGLRVDLLVPLDVVEGRRVKVEMVFLLN